MGRDRIFGPRRRRPWRWFLLLALALAACYWRPGSGTVEPTTRTEAVTEVEFPSVPVAPPPALTARSAILMDAATGTVLYAKAAHVRRPMASTTKMMTALVVLENAKPEEWVTVSEHASKTPYSSAYLRKGERTTVKGLLWAMLLRSANDACVVAAEHVAGSEARFVAMMNARAKAMRLRDTHFVNPHGLHAEGHYSSAYDLAQIARTAMQHPLFAEIVARKTQRIVRTISVKDVLMVNKNRLLYRWDAADGVKTGYTRQAGHCLVASASQGGWRLLAVVLKSADSCGESRALLEHGFRHYQRVVVARRGTRLSGPEVLGRDGERVAAAVARDVTVVAPRSVKVVVRTRVVPGRVRAPVLPGEPVGTLVVQRGHAELGRSQLVSARAVEEASGRRVPAVLIAGLAALGGALMLRAGARRYGRASAEGPGRRRRRLSPRL